MLKKRNRYSADERLELIHACKSSGLTYSEFARKKVLIKNPCIAGLAITTQGSYLIPLPRQVNRTYCLLSHQIYPA